MKTEVEKINYLLTNSILLTENNINEVRKVYEDIFQFEEFLASKSQMPVTINVIRKVSDDYDNASEPEKKKQFLLDYSALMHFLIKYIKGGLKKKDEDGSSQEWFADKKFYNRQNFDSTFKDCPVIKKYCDDSELNTMSIEPVLLFDDEECSKTIAEMKDIPIVVPGKVIDTQIMAEAMLPKDSNYQLDQVIASIGKLLQIARNVGSPDLLKNITTLRAALIRLNGKPIPLKYRILGAAYPPEAFVTWRLEERLATLYQRGVQILKVVKQAEDQDNQISEEEAVEIKNAIARVLQIPSKKFNSKSMGFLMNRTVEQMENQLYLINPMQLADDLEQSIQQRVEKLPEESTNKYYTALQQMFTTLPKAPATTPNDAFAKTEPTTNGLQTQGEQTPGAQGAKQQVAQPSADQINLNDPMQVKRFVRNVFDIANQAYKSDLKTTSSQFKQALIRLANTLPS